MPVSADGLRRLASLNLSAEQMATVLNVVADSISTDDDRRRKDRERKAAKRGKSAEVPRTIQGQSAEFPRTIPSPVSPMRDINSTPSTPSPQSSLRSDSSAEGADLFSAEKIDRAKAKADARRIELKSFGEAWNDIAADHRLPEIDSIDPGSTRERQALATLKWLRDHDSDPQAFFAKIRAGPYLLGEVNGFRASFDWVCKAANRQKIMDGNYENREKAKSFVDQFRAPHIAR